MKSNITTAQKASQDKEQIINEFDPLIEKFDELLKESKTTEVKKWSDLEIVKVYIIKPYKDVNTVNGPSTVLTMKRFREVWCPGHIAEKIDDKKPPFSVRPLGLKPCAKN